MAYVRYSNGSVLEVRIPPAYDDEVEVVVIDKDKWDRLVELFTADLPWERHEIRDIIEEVGK